MLALVDDQRVGAALRAARVRRGLRQVDVATLARVSHTTVSRMERGHLETLTLRAMRSVARALDIRLDVAPWSRRGDVMRFATADHAALVEDVIATLLRLGWAARAEVSFSEYGERGFVDVLAWFAPTKILLVIEVKTEIVDVGELVGILDRKLRLATRLARRFGWDAEAVSCALIVADTSTNRRRVAAHATTFRSLLPADGRALRGHLRSPRAPVRAVSFWSPAHRGHGSRVGPGVRRVRRPSKAR